MKLLTRLLVFLFLAGFISCSENQTTTGARMSSKYTLRTRNTDLFGNVKSVRVITYKKFVPEDQIDQWVLYSNYDLDSAGYISFKRTFLVADSFFSEYYKRDQYHNEIEILKKDMHDNPEILTQYTLDDRGNSVLTKETYLKTGVVNTWRSKYEYDSNNNIIEPSSKVEDGITRDKKKVYDERGYVVEESEYANDQLKYKFQYKYNSEGKVIEQKLTGPDPNMYNSIMSTVYDTTGRELSRKFVVPYDSTKNYFYQYKYDSVGNVIEYRYEEDGRGLLQWKSYKTVFEYDKHNNWIKRSTFFLDGKPRDYTEREVIYY